MFSKLLFGLLSIGLLVTIGFCSLTMLEVFEQEKQLATTTDTWSSDHEWLVFAGGGCEGNSDENEIYRMRFDGTELEQLTDNSRLDYSPIWSSDGQWIAFVSERRNITFLWQDHDAEIVLIRPDGSGLLKLTDNDSDDESISWSPDGHWLGFRSTSIESLGVWDLYRMRPDGSDVQRLTVIQDIRDYAWSPDGKSIAVVAESSKIYLINLGNGSQHQIVSMDSISSVSWSPDGEWLAFISGNPFVPDSSKIYRVKPDGSQLSEIATKKRISSSFIWSPDSEYGVYSGSDEQSGSELFLLSIDGSKEIRLTNERGAHLSPIWSHDGKWIYFTSNRPEPGITPFQIYRIMSDGTKLDKLTDMDCGVGSPALPPT